MCREPRQCFVKNALMTTRAVGHARLKYQEFNSASSDFDEEHGYRKPLPNFNGPYITAEPDIQVVKLTAKDRYIVMASDGLWDEVKRKEVP